MVISKGKGRFSSHILCQSILKFFSVERLYPKGMCAQMECVERWALRMGQALQRLASWSHLKEHIIYLSLSPNFPKDLQFVYIHNIYVWDAGIQGICINVYMHSLYIESHDIYKYKYKYVKLNIYISTILFLP